MRLPAGSAASPTLTAARLVADELTIVRQVSRAAVISLTEASAHTKAALTPSAAADSAQRHWLQWYVAALVGLDAIAFLLGGLVGQLARFKVLGGDVSGVPYTHVLLPMAFVWVALLAFSRTYEARLLGIGSEEYRRVLNAGAHLIAVAAIAVFLFKWDVARGLVVVALPTAVALTLVLRYLARRVLQYLRAARDVATQAVLVVGDGLARDHLAQRLEQSPAHGYRVVGKVPALAATPGGAATVGHIRRVAASLGARTVAIAHSEHVTAEVLRRVAWSLEGSGVDLLVAPALTDVAGPRIHIRPVSGLPLLQIAEPQFTGVRRVLKKLFDLALVTGGLVVVSPLMAAVAGAVKLSSPGPVLFRQTRIGLNGEPFPMLKFRSMYVDAEERLEELRALNDHGDAGVLFKMVDDPRVTRVGRILRRFSLDELPQLFNVLAGHMSLIGPRPPLPDEVARYETDVHRRLLVPPGITGLWQVSGRSDLSWDETVRLDLYYVENWSMTLDLEILWKTFSAVLRGAGAR